MKATKEQEDKFEKSFFELIKNAGNMLTVDFASDCGKRRVSTATLKYDVVYLFLNTEDSFEAWVDALLNAEELCGKLEDKRGWERNNPIFEERIQAKFRHIRK